MNITPQNDQPQELIKTQNFKQVKTAPPINIFEEVNTKINVLTLEKSERNPIYDSAVADSPFTSFIGGLIDLFDGKSKDGKIGNTKQGATGDCWLLSGINALSYTEQGRKIIENALEYHDGYTIVHTAAGDYKVTDEELNQTKASEQYSDGDDDMIILELAIEKIIDDVINGNIELSENAPEFLKKALLNMDENGVSKATEEGYSSTEGGWERVAMYLLSGQLGESRRTKVSMEATLEEFKANNNESLAVCADIQGENKEATDIYGNKINLAGGHAYSIKNYDGKNVTVINPWDSSEEIVLSKEEFLRIFDGMDVCDTSKSNTPEYFEKKKENHFTVFDFIKELREQRKEPAWHYELTY